MQDNRSYQEQKAASASQKEKLIVRQRGGGLRR